MPRTRWSNTRWRRRRRGTRNLLDRDAIAAHMDEAIPGSRVRAATKHGTLTVDELAAMQPGMARLMDELSRRYWVLYYAAKDRKSTRLNSSHSQISYAVFCLKKK